MTTVNRYQRGNLIGKGGQGSVYEGVDTHTGQPVALKFLLPELAANDSESIERFQREGEALRQLNHPNIVKIFEFCEIDGATCIVTELVTGGSLSDFIKTSAPLPVDQVLKIALELADALTRAHHLDIIHRDIKPDNILLAEDGTPRLTDFGLARLTQSASLTDERMIVGTLPYLSPEAINNELLDEGTDIWAFGVTLFKMLTGIQPFRGETIGAICHAILRNAPDPDLEVLRPDVPLALTDLIYRMLEKDRRLRIPTVRLIGAELWAVMRGVELTPHTLDVVVDEDIFDITKRFPALDRPKHNLPAQTTPFVGREAELDELAGLLADTNSRLVTILGSGGMGKTRLALELAQGHVSRSSSQQAVFADGVYFVPLAPLSDPSSIAAAIADAIGYQLGQDERDARQQILDYLREKNSLLVIDNFEHLLAGAELVHEILETAARLQIVVTSRERPNLNEETIFHISGMEFPDWETPDDALEYAAVKLFMQSARRAQPGFELQAEELRYVARICRLVEGMPLGILMAAAWVDTLSLVEIADEIQRSIDFLETTAGPDRHRSIRAVFDPTWNQLNDVEREVFMKLSVFRDGFTREAVQYLTGANLRTLATFVHKSMLRRDAGTGRYHIHELLRKYAEEHLDLSGVVDVAHEGHCEYFADFMQGHAENLRRQRQLAALDTIEADFENIRAAWSWAILQRNFAAIDKMLGRLSFFCLVRRFQERRPLLQLAREQLAPRPNKEAHPIWGRLLILESIQAAETLQEGDRQRIENGLEIVRQHKKLKWEEEGLLALGRVVLEAGDADEALSLLEESLAISTQIGDHFNIAAGLLELAKAHRKLGHREQAIDYARQCLDLSRDIGDKFWAAHALSNTGIIAFFTGNFSEAERYHLEANTIFREMMWPSEIVNTNLWLYRLASLREDFATAEMLKDEAREIAEQIGNQRLVSLVQDVYPSARKGEGESDTDEPEEKVTPSVQEIPTKIDRFEVRERLGEGGQIVAFQAYDPENEHDVVIRLSKSSAIERFDSIEVFRRRLKRLADLLAGLDHPALPKLYGYEITEEQAYSIEEFIDGKNLGVVLEETKGFLAVHTVIDWAIQLCDVLIYLHNHEPMPIIHRDIKDTNIMVDANDKIIIIDLGIMVGHRPGRGQTAIGTEGYAPPEQYWGYTDGRSDIYALGVTLLQLLTKHDPRNETLFKHHTVALRSLNPAISEALESVILKAVQHNPEKRYQTAEEMKVDLIACQET